VKNQLILINADKFGTICSRVAILHGSNVAFSP